MPKQRQILTRNTEVQANVTLASAVNIDPSLIALSDRHQSSYTGVQ